MKCALGGTHHIQKAHEPFLAEGRQLVNVLYAQGPSFFAGSGLTPPTFLAGGGHREVRQTLGKHVRADDDEMRGCAVGYAEFVRQSCHEQGLVALSVDEQRRSRLSGGANVKVQPLQARVRQRMSRKLIRHSADSDLEAGRAHLSTCSQRRVHRIAPFFTIRNSFFLPIRLRFIVVRHES